MNNVYYRNLGKPQAKPVRLFPCETSIKEFLAKTVDEDYFMKQIPEEKNKYLVKATKKQFDEFFNEYDCVVVEYPDDMRVYSPVKFYRRKEPERLMRVDIADFFKKPYERYRKLPNRKKKATK